MIQLTPSEREAVLEVAVWARNALGKPNSRHVKVRPRWLLAIDTIGRAQEFGGLEDDILEVYRKDLEELAQYIKGAVPFLPEWSVTIIKILNQ